MLAFAAYNAGPGNVNKFRHKAKEMGLDPNVWFGNVENSAASIAGRETVQYVGNIYKYYVAYTMLAERLQENADAFNTGTKGGSALQFQNSRRCLRTGMSSLTGSCVKPAAANGNSAAADTGTSVALVTSIGESFLAAS